MTLVNQLFLFTTALWNLFARIIYLPFAILASVVSILQQWRAILGLLLLGGAFFIAAQYTGPVADSIEFTFRCRINPFYNETIRPILAGIIREFFNRIVCWYNAFLWYPYGLGRTVIFPILRDGGFGATITALARFFGALAKDIILNYIFTGDVFSKELDFANICVKWQEFWATWQSLLCFGCNDLCPYFTKLPVIPAFFGSDQIKDDQWWCFIGNATNGIIHIFQRIIYVIREIIWPTQPIRPRFEFKRAFELFCEASACFWKSWENAMQTVWDNFVPYAFVWKDMFCFFDKLTCTVIRFAYFVTNMIVNADRVLLHFAGRDDGGFWKMQVKEDFKEMINTLAPASYFDTISEALPGSGGNMTISSYQLLSNNQAKPNGKPNPLYNMTTAGECMCIAITRVLCDPQNNGTTCETQFNGTLLAGIDPCCLGTETFTMVADWSSFFFEFTLHLGSANDFFLYMDRQPFTSLIKQDVVRLNACLAQVFLGIQTYGSCLQKIIAELGDFIVCSIELVYRIIIAIITLPYFSAFLPGYCNFITCPGPNNALGETLKFLDKIGNTTNPDGLINCMCFTLNTGFRVSYAGCTNVTCQPTGFIPPTPQPMSRMIFRDSFYNLTTHSHMYAHRLTPVMTYGDKAPHSFQFATSWDAYAQAGPAFHETFEVLDRRAGIFADDCKCKKRQGGDLVSLNITNPPLNCTDPMNPPPCFNLCCLPSKLIQLYVHTVAMTARSINGAFQSQFSDNGSDYWTGEACTMGKDCFQSDATTFVVRLFAPIECVCETIKLVLPPQGFGDPCCGITVATELISCVIQIIINVGNSVGGDSPNFTYIRDPQFLAKDFDIVLEIALKLFDCLCNFVRTIFAVALRGTDLARGFDPCCVFRVWFRAILEILRLGFRVLLSLATQQDNPESECYLYVNNFANARPNCTASVENLPIVKQFRKITEILLAPPVTQVELNQCPATMPFDAQDVNQDGLPTCICRMVNALLALVYQVVTDQNQFMGSYDANPTCTVNLCCIIYSYARFLKELLDVAAQLIATLWQNWEYKTIMGEPFFLPQETLYYFFCDEYGSKPFINTPSGPAQNPAFYGNTNPTSILSNNVTNPSSATSKCGKLEPALFALEQLLGGCLCIDRPGSNNTLNTITNQSVQSGIGIANVLDDLVRWLVFFATQTSSIFPYELSWPRCLCDGGPFSDQRDRGIIKPAAKAIVVLARQVIVTVRNIANPVFWAFDGITLSDESQSQQIANALTDNFDDLRKTWVNRFLAPFADAMCTLITNMGCLLSMILGTTCEASRYNVLSSATRYYFEALIRLISTIEGIVKLFTQEPPGLCVGSEETTQGNFDRPEEQGTTGTTGNLVPTCSPSKGRTVQGVQDGKLSRILTATLGFVVDALIGIGRFSCSQICPGFDPNQVNTYKFTTTPSRPPFNKRFTDGTIVSQQSVCDCWNKSPYTGIQSGPTSVCGWELCDRYYNSGKGNFKCPGTLQICDNELAKLPPNTGLAATEQEQLEVDRNKFCQACSNITTQVGPNNQIFEAPNARSWGEAYPQHRFTPIVLNYQPSGLGCQIITTFPQTDITLDVNALKLLNDKVGENLLAPGPIGQFPGTFAPPNPVGGPNILWPIGTPFVQPTKENFCDVNPFLPAGNPDFRLGGAFTFDNNKPWYPGACALYELCETPGFEFTLGDQLRKASVLYDGICRRAGPALGEFGRQAYAQASVSGAGTPLDAEFGTSIAQNACQLCIMAIQNQTTFNGTFYPATIQHTCERSYCIIEKPLCRNDQMVPCRPGEQILDGVIITILKYFDCLMQSLFGNFPALVIRAMLIILSIIWQLAGGIIRFVVAVFFVVWSFFSRPFSLAILQFIPNIIAAMGQFGAIFTQPISLGYRDGVTVADPLMASISTLYAFDDAHDCIDAVDAVKCFCRAINMRPLCGINATTGLVEPAGLTTTDVLMYLRDHFSGKTNCDMLLDFLVTSAPATWLEIEYARRYELVQCVTQRSKGERFERFSNGMLPPDFFYNPKAWYKVLDNAFHQTKRIVMGGNSTRRAKRADHFKAAFKMDRNKYFKFLNARGRLVKKFYMQEQGIREDSPIMGSMLRMDMHQFMWHSGYYNYLLHEATWANFNEKMPTFTESLYELRDATHELVSKTHVIWDDHKEHVQRTIDKYAPPTPPLLKAMWDGSFWRGIAPKFPMFRMPYVKFHPPVLENVTLLPRDTVWTEEKERNINAGWRLLYSALHLFWPHHTSKEVHDRFILNGNCRLVDGAVNLAVEMVDYCLNEFKENIPEIRDSPIGPYLENTSHLRRGGFHARYQGRMRWVTTGTGNWSRPKLDYIPLEARVHVHSQMYQRAVPAESLIGKLLIWVGNLFGVDLFQTLDTFIANLQNFVSNPNTDIKDYPDVGARYWATFLIRCEFPENLNCSIGIGLGSALWRVGLIYLIVFAVLAFIFPQLLSFISFAVNIIVYILIVAIVAWHYSPACIALFPSSELSGAGITIPVLPIPLNIFPALPECLWDDIIKILDDIFAMCYDWIPLAWINSSTPCATCDDRIGFINCVDVGVSTPIETLVYWGWRIFGGFWCDFMRGLSSNLALQWIPFFGQQVSETCNLIETASPTQLDRMEFCGYLSIGTLAWFGVLLYVGAIFIIAIVPALLNIGHAILLLFPTLPWYDAIVGLGEEQGSFVIDGERAPTGEEEEEEEEEKVEEIGVRYVPNPQPGFSDYIASGIRRAFMSHQKTE